MISSHVSARKNRKKCSRCDKIKRYCQFAQNSDSPDKLRSICKLCDAKRARKYRSQEFQITSVNKICNTCAQIKSTDAFRPDKVPGGLRGRCRWCDAKIEKIRKARIDDIEIDADFILSLPLPDICPVLGIKLSLGRITGHACSPSFDRINPKYGYIPGNVQVISSRANSIKSDATPSELMQVALFVNAQWHSLQLIDKCHE